MKKESSMVEMRDGTNLATDIFTQEKESNWPVVLMRTPYNKDEFPVAIEKIVDAGYAFVIQDCRGRFSSEGRFEALVDESKDGEDTVRWILDQRWCNGKVGLFGMSYLAATSWLTAINDIDGVVTAVSAVGGSIFNGWYYAPGVFQLDTLFFWNISMMDNENDRHQRTFGEGQLKAVADASAASMTATLEYVSHPHPESSEYARLGQAREYAINQVSESAAALLRLPLYQVAEQITQYAPWVQSWIDNPDPSTFYWQAADWSRKQDRINVPMLHIVGWYDLFVRSGLKDFAAISARADAPFQKLIVGPDSHITIAIANDDTPIGERVFSYKAIIEDWFLYKTSPHNNGRAFSSWACRWLKDDKTVLHDEAPITLYVMGENVWRDEWEWPLSRTQWTPLYLNSGGNANSVRGDGTLSFQPPDTPESYDRFQYDPANPVPSLGGTFLGALGPTPGVFEQSTAELRHDVLVYTSDKLENPLELTGPVTARLWVTTSAVDTDFTAKLVDVLPDGSAYNICDGVTRLRYRPDKPGLVAPNTLQEVVVELSPTSFLFKASHRIRVQVSSSNFPLFDPNSNTGKSLLSDPTNEMLVARQTVYHDSSRPSHMILPVIPRQNP